MTFYPVTYATPSPPAVRGSVVRPFGYRLPGLRLPYLRFTTFAFTLRFTLRGCRRGWVRLPVAAHRFWIRTLRAARYTRLLRLRLRDLRTRGSGLRLRLHAHHVYRSHYTARLPTGSRYLRSPYTGSHGPSCWTAVTFTTRGCVYFACPAATYATTWLPPLYYLPVGRYLWLCSCLPRLVTHTCARLVSSPFTTFIHLQFCRTHTRCTVTRTLHYRYGCGCTHAVARTPPVVPPHHGYGLPRSAWLHTLPCFTLHSPVLATRFTHFGSQFLLYGSGYPLPVPVYHYALPAVAVTAHTTHTCVHLPRFVPLPVATLPRSVLCCSLTRLRTVTGSACIRSLQLFCAIHWFRFS